jgi:hypothetical protein
VREIFAHYGAITSCALAIDERVQLSKGYAGMYRSVGKCSSNYRSARTCSSSSRGLPPGRCGAVSVLRLPDALLRLQLSKGYVGMLISHAAAAAAATTASHWADVMFVSATCDVLSGTTS